jgi:hypothetical protein
MLTFGTDILANSITTNNQVITGYAPFTLTINPSAFNISSGRKIYKIDYIYDNSEIVSQTLFIAPSSIELPYSYETGDPRNYKQIKTFYLPNVYKKDYQITIKAYYAGIDTPTEVNFYLSLSAPEMDGTLNGFFSSVHLIHTRMFGLENNILYVFETKDPNYFIPVVFNWKSRPVAPPPLIIDDGYRPFRIFEPYENQKSTNAYKHIDFFNDQEVYDQDPTYPKY